MNRLRKLFREFIRRAYLKGRWDAEWDAAAAQTKEALAKCAPVSERPANDVH